MVFMWQLFIEFFLFQALYLALNEMDKNPYELISYWGEGIENKQDKI